MGNTHLLTILFISGALEPDLVNKQMLIMTASISLIFCLCYCHDILNEMFVQLGCLLPYSNIYFANLQLYLGYHQQLSWQTLSNSQHRN